MIKTISGAICSFRLTLLLLAVFAVSIATATFIENDFGAQTAHAVVYDSWWFQAILFLGIINLTGIILNNKLYVRKKFSIFLFHLAFIVILCGAAITHYFGFDGMMHIRKGESSNQVVGSTSWFYLKASDEKTAASTKKKMIVSALGNHHQTLSLNIGNKKVTAECLQTIPHAMETVQDDPSGKPILEFMVAGMENQKSILLSTDKPRKIGDILFSLNDSVKKEGINITWNNNGLTFVSSHKVIVTSMATMAEDSLLPGKSYPFLLKTLYNIGGIQFVAKRIIPSGKIVVSESRNASANDFPTAVWLKVGVDGKSDTILYYAYDFVFNKPVHLTFGNVTVSAGIGPKILNLPFSLYLKDFILQHYPGSSSPSWFESKLLLEDASNGLQEDRRVFMNNVLKYKGYRFYQTSYDPDQAGTVLSVNRDFWGTAVTYAGYLLLFIGIVLSLANPRSRFRKISMELKHAKQHDFKKAAVCMIGMLFAASAVFAKEDIPDSTVINASHADLFGRLLIQDEGGRIKPVNTFSSELIRKISLKTNINGQNSDQVVLGMLSHPDYWRTIPMIRVSNPEIKKLLNTSMSYVSFNDMFRSDSSVGDYILNSYVNDAYRKRPAQRDLFDNEVIRVNERVNLCYQIYTGEFLRVFPKPDDPERKWYSPMNVKGKFLTSDSVFVDNILAYYLQVLRSPEKNWKQADTLLNLIQKFQVHNGGDLIPSSSRVSLEIWYNKANIFDRLASFYGLTGFLLLAMVLLNIFIPRFRIKKAVNFFTVLILIGFTAHLAGLILRWYISGHAPWSNGYESMIYISFATMAAGILFSRKSPLTLAATALISWVILFVAHLNWMDPEITNLVPVLKSNWLLIHVAVITASYGFLFLGALLAFLNLLIMIFRTPGSFFRSEKVLNEVSLIIEMTLISGLYMLTIGTFLGGVWANESWGRYWGWDPKETWALVTILVYAFVAHMRLVPGLKSLYLFNLMSVLAVSSVIMTYFGVNYYLSGMHSYAKGDPLPIPSFVYYAVAIVLITGVLAYLKQKMLASNPQIQSPIAQSQD